MPYPGVNTPPLASMPATTFAAVTSVVTDCPVQHLLERAASVAGVVSHVVHLVGLGPRHADGRGLGTAGGEVARGEGGVRVRFGVCGAGDGGARVANPRRRSGERRFASDDDGAPGRVLV